jgi:putative transposase
VSLMVKLKNPTRKKHGQWLKDQEEYTRCLNWSVAEIYKGRKLSSKNVPHKLKSCIKNEAIRAAGKAVRDFKSGKIGRLPVFKRIQPVGINNQNWDMKKKDGKWYIGFSSGLGKKYLPVVECEHNDKYYEWFVKKDKKDSLRYMRGTAKLLRKGSGWYLSIPFKYSVELKKSKAEETPVGVDLGLRHIAVVSELKSGKRKFFSGKRMGYIRRHHRSLRRSLGRKKALRAIKSAGKKEGRRMADCNRKLAKEIVEFALGFENPVIKMEKLERIRETCRSMKRADRTIHSWSFYQLQKHIEQKALKHGIPVVYVNPEYTSQKCFKCGYTDRANRNGDRFVCKRCGYSAHADLNASRNIAADTLPAGVG